jgi:polysaccharide deacetylase 2 family uncharacterized protein YibQ
MSAAPRRTGWGWRALGLFWTVVALLVLGVTGGLAWLGPPPPIGGAAAGGPAPFAEAPRDAAGRDRAEERRGAAPDAGTASPPAPEAGTGAPSGDRAAAGIWPPPAPEPPPLASVVAVSAPAARPPPGAPRPIPPPDPALIEERAGGARLPRIGPGGRTSFRAYAHADFDRADTRPRVAVVVAGIGLSASNTEEAIRRLPPAVALALNPYAQRLGQVAERARERGMETLIAVPMEAPGYPLADPGDRALLTSASLAENLHRLDWVLARSAGYVGVLGGLGPPRGERFAPLAELLGSVQDVLCTRGLLYLDSRPGAPDPARAWGRTVDVILDEPATRGEIERRLAELERLARERGSALGLAGDPAPVLVERLAAWAVGLDARGVALAPVTAVIRRPTSARCEGEASPDGRVAPAAARR